jgi:hypothetical protein
MTSSTEKLLNKNVRAMLSGRKKDLKKPDFHFDKVVSIFRKKCRVEVKIFLEDPID